MIRLAIAQLRRRGWRYVSLFFAIFAAVGLTVGTVAIVESLQKTVNGMFDKPYAGVDFVAQVRSSNSSELDALLERPGFAFDQQVSASIKEAGNLYSSTYLRSLAQDPQLQWRAVLEGRAPVGPGEVAVVDDTPVGAQLELNTPGDREDKLVTVVGRMEQSAQEQLMGQRSVLADQATVRQWAGETATGELRIRSVAPPQNLPERSVQELRPARQYTAQLAEKYLSGRDQYFLLLTAFMVIVAVVAMLVIFSSYQVLAAERQREYALLRAVGSSSWQLQGSTIAESVLLAAVAGAAGIPAGLAAAGWAGRNADKIGVRVPLDTVQLEPKWLAVIFVMALATSVVGALPAASGAIRRPLVESLTASAPRQSMARALAVFLVGAVAVVAGGYALQFSSQLMGKKALVIAIGGAGIFTLGVAAVVAVLFPLLIQGLSRFAVLIPSLHLGMAFAGKQRLRAGALVAIVVAGAALVSAVLQGQQQLEQHLLSKATNKGAVDVAVRAIDGRIPDGLVDQVRATQGVAAAEAPTMLPVTAGEVKDNIFALSEQDGAAVLRGPVTGARPGELVLGVHSPLRNQLRDGKRAQVQVGGNAHELDVRYNEGPESFVDPVVTPEVPAVARPGVDTRLPQPVVLARLTGDYAQPADNPTVRALKQVVAGAGEQVTFQEAFSARQDVADSTKRVLSLSTLMSIVALLIAGVGVFNTVTLMVRERRQDYALLAAIGLTTFGRLALQIIELIFLVLPAALVGVAVGGLLGSRIATQLTHVPGVGSRVQGLIDAVTAGHTPVVVGAAVVIALLAGVLGSLRRGY
ncbi:ABC transporter permease [Corynebacterium epidermidicanis]|uniref:FtsX-like permease family n=1 Tax=Corynebacterium epidermidicanis TaxID=1050174 RepID=A0A0G3GT27_9CORY|nr:ABC transporter permease [Corynebacterium epidermidicanis]AKK02017.1 FtsX-like permease family [Corynebacterium epidermidicanis]